MSFISIGDLSNTMRLRFLNAEIKGRVSQLAGELASGRVSDLSKHLAGNLDRLGSVNRSLKLTEAYQISISELVARGTGLQLSLGQVQSAINSSGASSISAASAVTSASLDAAATAALEDLQSAVGALNVQSGARALFSGQAFKSSAVAPADSILDDLETLATGATTAAQIETIIDDYFFASGGGYETSAYLGSDTDSGLVRVSETETAGYSVSASSTEIRQALAGLATAALLTRGIFGSDLVEKVDLLKSAGETMLSAAQGVIAIRAEIGGVQARLERISVGNVAQKTALEITLNDMIGADGYETATKLQGAEASLEALYIATTRLSQLSLTRYL